MANARVSLLVLVCASVCLGGVSRTRRRWAVDDDGCRTPDRGSGICSRISNCQPMLNFLASKPQFTQKEIAALQSYQCGIYGNEPKVCCPKNPITLEWVWEDAPTDNCVNVFDCKIIYDYIIQNDVLSEEIKAALRGFACGTESNGGTKVRCPTTLPPVFQQGPKDDTTHPNYQLLPKRCGSQGTSEKITNGNETSLFEYPWAAALKYDKPKNPYSCGGSLINNQYILTAAHCIKSQSKLVGVRLGEHNFKTDPDCQGEAEEQICAEAPQDFEIDASDAIVHPGYKPPSLQNDIALIRLRRPANTTVYSVGPICLPGTASEKTDITRNFTVIGWGATETGYASPILLKVSVPRVDIPECAPKYASQQQVNDNQICAGGANQQDSCAGDSGGPLSNEYTADGRIRTIQYGIVSFGTRFCGIESFPAVYTRVDKYMTWILDNLKP